MNKSYELLRTVSRIQEILAVIIIIANVICKCRILFFSSNFLIRISGESWVVKMRKEDLSGQWKCSHQDSQVFILKDLHFLGGRSDGHVRRESWGREVGWPLSFTDRRIAVMDSAPLIQHLVVVLGWILGLYNHV